MKRTSLCLLLALVLGCDDDKPRVHQIAFSPDGHMVAFTIGDALCVADVAEQGLFTRTRPPVDVKDGRFDWSPDSRQIAYTSDKEGSWDLWLWDVREDEHSRLAPHLAKDYHPTFWPGRDRVLFLSTRDRNVDIWHVDTAGREPQQLTDDDRVESHLAVSADGRWLGYVRTNTTEDMEIVLRDLAKGSDHSRPWPHSLTQLDIAADGSALAWASDDGIYVADVDAGAIGEPERKVQRAGDDRLGVAWAPSGDALLVADGKRILRKGLTLLTFDKALTGPLKSDSVPAWHPREKRFAYAPLHEKGHFAAVIAPIGEPEQRQWVVANAGSTVSAAEFERDKGLIYDALALASLAVEPGEKKPPAEAKRLHAELLADVGDTERALEIYKADLRDPGGEAMVHFLYTGDFQAVRRALTRVPEDKRTGDHKRVLAALDHLKPATLDLLRDAMAQERRREWDDAFEAYLRFADTAAGNPDAADLVTHGLDQVFDIGKLHLRDVAEVERACRSWLDHHPRHPVAASAALRLGKLLADAEQFRAAAKQYGRVVVTYDGVERARAGVALAKLYAEKLHDLPRARATAQAAFDHGAAAEATDAMLEAWAMVVELRLRLGHPAVEVRDWAAEQKLNVGKDGGEDLARAISRCVAAFDKAHVPQVGNDALARLLPLVPDMDGLEEFLEAQAKHVLHHVGAEPFVKCKLGHLPNWLEARAETLLKNMDTRPKSDERDQMRYALRLLVAQRPQDVRELLASLEAKKGDEALSDENLRMARWIAHYVVGNFYQTQRDLAHALDEYARLPDLQKEGDKEDYGPVLDECRKLLPARNHIVRQWLDLERDIGHGLWQPSTYILGLVTDAQDQQTLHQQHIRDYERFLSKHHATSLADDACFRLIQIYDGMRRRRWAEYLVREYPDSRLYGNALLRFVSAHRSVDMPWVGTQVLGDLLAQPRHSARRPGLHLAIGVLYQEGLRRFDLAKPHLETVSKQFPDAIEWAEAEKRLIEAMIREGDLAPAVGRLTALRAKRPDFEWVKKGHATLELAKALEKLGDWPRAEAEYVRAITKEWPLEGDERVKLLRRLLPRLSPASVERILQAVPQDLQKAKDGG